MTNCCGIGDFVCAFLMWLIVTSLSDQSCPFFSFSFFHTQNGGRIDRGRGKKPFVTSRCRARASRTQEMTWLQGTVVTNTDKQVIGSSGSPKAVAPGYMEGHGSMQLTGTGTTRTGAQVERGCCARASRCRTLVESAKKDAIGFPPL